MLGAVARRVRRRLMVPERDEPPYALGARDIVDPGALFRAQFAMRSLLLCPGLGGGDG